MIAFLFPIVRYLGFGGVIAVGMLVFYEGVPLGPVRYIPYVGPALEQFVDGRVDREYRRGQLNERSDWRRRIEQAERDRLAELKLKQDELDQLALNYYTLKAENRVTSIALDEAIAEAQKEEPDAPTDAPVCRRVFPKRVLPNLNAIR